MSRLILKENVNRVIQKAFDDGRISYTGWQYLMDRIAEIPDGLIRCKDCKHLGENDGYYFCNEIGIAFGDKPNWFCADGEVKNDE